MMRMLINRVFARRKEKPVELTPEQVEEQEKVKKEALFQQLKSLGNLTNADSSGWKTVRDLIEARIEDCLRNKINLDSRDEDQVKIMRDIDTEIDAMRRFIKIPGYFISKHQNLLEEEEIDD